MPFTQRWIIAVSLLAALGTPEATRAQLKLRDICRVKGQEQNTLHGMGLVVGLKGTGDGDVLPTSRALATMMKLMGNPLTAGPLTDKSLEELKAAKNVALVFVTATIPSAGGRQGDGIDCEVSAISAQSLKGGRLLLTPLLGPRPGNNRVYALAAGPVNVADVSQPATGQIHGGCRLEEDFFNPFVLDGAITLVLNKDHAGFGNSQEVADMINSRAGYFGGDDANRMIIAKAVDQKDVQIIIPTEEYREDPVLFLSIILKLNITELQTEARVVVNERAGTVVVGADVQIGPVVVTHKNIVVEAGGGTGNFVGVIDPQQNEEETAKLKSMVDALNALRVPTEDVIAIIKDLETSGSIYGKLIVE